MSNFSELPPTPGRPNGQGQEIDAARPGKFDVPGTGGDFQPVLKKAATQGRRTCPSGPISLGAVLGTSMDAAGQQQRLTLKGNYKEPTLPFPRRMAWFRKVQRLAAAFSQERKSYPHKLMAVANVIASIGNVCRLSFDSIALRAGCCPNTAQSCVAWLEEQGALTWNRTARKHRNGRMVRSSNLYTLIEDFQGLLATVVRAVRAIWRDRPTVFSNGNECHGMPQQISFKEHLAAKERLAEIAKRRQAELHERWQAKFT
jgi:hypothetical protein